MADEPAASAAAEPAYARRHDGHLIVGAPDAIAAEIKAKRARLATDTEIELGRSVAIPLEA